MCQRCMLGNLSVLAVEGEGGPVLGWGTRALAGDNEFAPQTLPLLSEYSMENKSTHGDSYRSSADEQ